MLLVGHDFVEQRNPRRDRDVLDGIALRDVINRLQFVLRDVAVKFIFLLERLLVFEFSDLTSCRADGLASEVLQ